VFNIEMKESQQQLYLSVKICEHARRLSRDNPLFFLEVYFCNLFYSADIGNGKFHNEHGEYIYIYSSLMNRDEKPLDFGVLFLEQTHGFHGF